MRAKYDDILQPVNELVMLVYKHFGKTPMGWTKIDKLTEYAHGECFVANVLDMYYFLKKKPEVSLEINASQIYKIIYKFQLASKSLPIAVDTLSECYMFLANYAVKQYNSTYLKVKNRIEKIDFFSIDSLELGNKLRTLSAVMRGWTEVVFCDEHTIAEEIVSPLSTVENELVIYRKFINLDIEELYGSENGCEYNSIELYYKYNDLCGKPNTDIVGNLLVECNLSQSLNGFYIEATDREGNVVVISESDQIEKICLYFRKTMMSIVKQLKLMTYEERLQKKMLCEYFSMKAYCDTVNKQWRPDFSDLNRDYLDSTRPIVRANCLLEKIDEEAEFIKLLLELNNPMIHW